MRELAGSAALIRLALRRDRVRLPVWVAGLVAVMAVSAATTAGNYPGAGDRLAAARLLARNPALLMLRGPAPGASVGGLVAAETVTILGVLTALMSAFTVIRHTRQNEETGRAELLGSAVVGRYAPLAAALAVALGACAALASGLAATLVARGLATGGAVATAAAIGATGVAFAGVAAVAAQVSQSGRGATAAAGAVLALAYLLRGVGDVLGRVNGGGVTVVSAWPAWLSPIGWSQRVRPFAENRLPVLGLHAVLFAVLVGVAVVLLTRRDLGQGLMSARPGPDSAGKDLQGSLGLAWRLQRGSLLGWALGLVVVGATFGSLGDQVEDLLRESPEFGATIEDLAVPGATPVDTFFAAMTTLLGAVAAVYAVQAVLRLRAEESGGRLEHLLAASVSRSGWLAGHLVCAVGGTAGLLLLTGSSMGLTYGLATGATATGLASLTGAALAHAPAALVLAAVVLAAFGLIPLRMAAASWTVLAASVLLGPLGEFLNLPPPLRDLSPLTHSPALPAAPFSATPVLALLAAAAAFGVTGLIAFRRRDLTP